MFEKEFDRIKKEILSTINTQDIDSIINKQTTLLTNSITEYMEDPENMPKTTPKKRAKKTVQRKKVTKKRKSTAKKSTKSATSRQAKPKKATQSRKNRAKKVATSVKKTTRKATNGKKRPDVEGIFNNDGWKLVKNKYEKDGWQVKVSRNRIIVFPRGALQKINYDKQFVTNNGYDGIAIKQGTPEEEVTYLVEFLNNANSPKQQRVQKKRKSKERTPKFYFCRYCDVGDEGETCSHIKESAYIGGYCSNVEFWNKYYCLNAIATPFKKLKKHFPNYMYYNCKLTKEICPYNYAYLVPNAEQIRPAEVNENTTKILLLSGLRAGCEQCKNFKKGLKIISKSSQDK